MKFKNLLKLTPVLLAIVLLGIPETKTHEVTNKHLKKLHITNGVELYFIISDRNGKCIEKVFINKTNAINYINTYKESHDYTLEENFLVE